MSVRSLLKHAPAAFFATSLLAACGAAHSAVVLGSIAKSYGSVGGRVGALKSGAGSCDTLNNSSITVRDTGTGCNRFADSFSLSAFSGASIDRFELTLDFAATNDLYLGLFREDWKVRPAAGNLGSAMTFDMANSNGVTTQTFVFDSGNLDVFSGIVSGGAFSLWFADQALGANNFSLRSATLTVIGTNQVPEPTSLALVGLALAVGGAVAAGRRKKA